MTPGASWVVTNKRAAKDLLFYLAPGPHCACADRQITPQAPRIHMNAFPYRLTAHAQTLKKNPQTPHITGSKKTRFIGNKNHLFGLMQSRIHALFTSGTSATSW